MQQIAEIVREVAVDAADERVAREIVVLAEVDLAQQEIADGIGTELVDEADGIDDVPLRLAHLVAVDDEPAVTVDLLRQRQIERHEDARPDDRMEAHDLLADEVEVRRPVFMEFLRIVEVADRREVVRERVEPDVDDVLRVDGHGDAPVEGRAADAEIIEPLLDEIDHLVAPRNGLDEIRMVLDVLEHAVLVLAHLEEIRFLRDLLHRAVAVRAAAVLVELVFRPVALAGRAVESLVLALVDVALRVDAAENLLNDALVALLRRADEIIVADGEAFPEVLEARDDLVRVLDGRHARLLGLLLDLEPVLIRAREEEDIVPLEAVEARNGIGNRRAVSVADMELRARIIDRRRDIEWFLLVHACSSLGVRKGNGRIYGLYYIPFDA